MVTSKGYRKRKTHRETCTFKSLLKNQKISIDDQEKVTGFLQRVLKEGVRINEPCAPRSGIDRAEADQMAKIRAEQEMLKESTWKTAQMLTTALQAIAELQMKVDKLQKLVETVRQQASKHGLRKRKPVVPKTGRRLSSQKNSRQQEDWRHEISSLESW